MADHTFLVCSSQGSRRRVFELSSKSSFAALATNAVYDSVGHWGPGPFVFDRLFAHFFICTVCCLQVIVWYFRLRVFAPTFPCLSVDIIDCTHLYLASALDVFYGGHARRDVFLYPYCLLLCINIVIMDCTQLYLASAQGVVYGDVHPRYQEDKDTVQFFVL